MKLTERKSWEISLSFTTLYIEITPVGEDIAILLRGGDRPHIGCCVLAVPRPSLTGDGSQSCTSSVINVTGHRDEELCRLLAEKACRHYGCTVTCSGGVHMDKIGFPQIQEVIDAVSGVELPSMQFLQERPFMSN